MSEGRSINTPSDAVFSGAGQGVFAGFVAAALSHVLWGANPLILVIVYGYVMAALRGWPELAGILTMIATTLLYFAIYQFVLFDRLSVSGSA